MGLERALKKHAGGMFLARGRVPFAVERIPPGMWATAKPLGKSIRQDGSIFMESGG